mgnify:CR=1 FL=1
MKNFSLFNFLVGLFVLVQAAVSTFNCFTFVLVFLGALNLFIAFGGMEWLEEYYSNKKNEKFDSNKFF